MKTLCTTFSFAILLASTLASTAARATILDSSQTTFPLYTTYNDGSIHRFGPTGTDLGSFPSFQPNGIAFDTSGNLYGLRGASNLIEKYSSTGTDLV